MTVKSFKCRLSQYCRKYESIYDEFIILKVEFPICLTLRMLLIPSYAHILFTNLCVVAATQLIMVKLKDISL